MSSIRLTLTLMFSILLSGCTPALNIMFMPVLPQYANKELRGYVKKCTTVEELKKEYPDLSQANSQVAKAPGHRKVLLVGTYSNVIHDGVFTVAPVKFLAIAPNDELDANVGDVLEVKTKDSILAGPTEAIAEVIKVVCRKSDEDFKACWSDPLRGGSLGIIDRKTGKAANYI